jgi:D-alanyl-lipoteichoic acid acyltransferase DltB (MBOAT superfamily)
MDHLNLSLELLTNLFTYQADSPTLFSTGFFFFLFTGFLMIFLAVRKYALTRIIYVTLFSLYFYYKTSGIWFLLLVFTATSDFSIAHLIKISHSQVSKKFWVAISLCINLGLLSYFKYANFLFDLTTNALQQIGTTFGVAQFQQLEYKYVDIFLPVGISFFTFQSLSYIIDVYRERIKPLGRWIDYLFYISFFPGLVAGPIVRARDFIPQMYKQPFLTKNNLGEGFYLIICGLFKKCVISDYISLNFVDRIFDAPTLYTGLENLLGVYGYALQIYCDFSGYSDMAIGIALLLGIRFKPNFNSPYQSATITEFWKRWHISLSDWLKDYLYIPLGGNRKGKTRTYVNLLITMLIGGLWHGAAIRFVLWGAIHGFALAIHRFLLKNFSSLKASGSEMTTFNKLWSTLLTFHIVCFSWIFFRVENMKTGFEVISQIFTGNYAGILLQFIQGYKLVFTLMAIGFVLHFLPAKLDNKLQQAVVKSPVVLQAVYLLIAIVVVVQIKSAGIVPFIYFKF